MKIYISGLPSGYEVEHLVRLFFPLSPVTAEEPLPQEDAVLAAAGPQGLSAELRRDGACARMTQPLPPSGRRTDYALAALVYRLLRRETGIRPPWGMLTGVRPVRLIHDARARGESEEQIAAFFLQTSDCSPEKFQLARQIADLQEPFMRPGQGSGDCSLYIGIPFCPSRCSYCSFVSCNLKRDAALVQPYVDQLCVELGAIEAQIRRCGLRLRTIYIGGGTPTSLSALQLRQLMGEVRRLFDLSVLEEYTVEAGRPDCTDAEKLTVLKEYGATRISINPQTFSDEVLRRIGRRHSAADIERCYREARAAGHGNINMDLIAGLPGDTVEGFDASLRHAIELAPENITVHTLTLKRASRIMMEGQAQQADADVAAMLGKCTALAQAGYLPYYLYRQKNTLQNLENTGWCRPGFEGRYNIYIMEEVHTILSAGAGGSTKLVQPGGSRIERIFNFKYPNEYLQRFDEVLDRKKGVSAFYERDSAAQASGGDLSGQCGGCEQR